MLQPSMLEFCIFPKATVKTILEEDEVAVVWPRKDDCIYILSEKEYNCLPGACERTMREGDTADFFKDPKNIIDEVIDQKQIVHLQAREDAAIVVVGERDFLELLDGLGKERSEEKEA